MLDLIPKLELIFRETLENDTICLDANTTPNEIAEWDSVNHLLLLHTIEQHFAIKFSLDEMIHFQKVSDICESIKQKL